MQQIADALREVVVYRSRGRTEDRVREGAAAGAAYLEQQLKEQKGDVTLSREMIVGLRSILQQLGG